MKKQLGRTLCVAGDQKQGAAEMASGKDNCGGGGGGGGGIAAQWNISIFYTLIAQIVYVMPTEGLLKPRDF